MKKNFNFVKKWFKSFAKIAGAGVGSVGLVVGAGLGASALYNYNPTVCMATLALLAFVSGTGINAWVDYKEEGAHSATKF